MAKAYRDNADVKILCTGLNYLSHIRETGREPPAEPLVFG
jgi:2-keto-4-pentenoate hydratase/2-oxohepta-3-ene-1,7-dioic acid hydratase in catechol pathway